MGRRAGRPYTLVQAAAQDQLILVKCGLCRRMVRYLASDLITLFGEHHPALKPPYPCSKCERWDYLRVDTYKPSLGDYGHLIIRRPNGLRVTQLWRNEPLGQIVKDDAEPVDEGYGPG